MFSKKYTEMVRAKFTEIVSDGLSQAKVRTVRRLVTIKYLFQVTSLN